MQEKCTRKKTRRDNEKWMYEVLGISRRGGPQETMILTIWICRWQAKTTSRPRMKNPPQLAGPATSSNGSQTRKPNDGHLGTASGSAGNRTEARQDFIASDGQFQVS